MKKKKKNHISPSILSPECQEPSGLRGGHVRGTGQDPVPGARCSVLRLLPAPGGCWWLGAFGEGAALRAPTLCASLPHPAPAGKRGGSQEGF